jgi:hypothetical protein
MNQGVEPPQPDPDKLTLLQTVGSVLSSFFGVQSGRHRQRDFQHGSAPKFIAVGLVLTALLILTLWLVVKLVLSHAGM